MVNSRPNMIRFMKRSTLHYTEVCLYHNLLQMNLRYVNFTRLFIFELSQQGWPVSFNKNAISIFDPYPKHYSIKKKTETFLKQSCHQNFLQIFTITIIISLPNIYLEIKSIITILQINFLLRPMTWDMRKWGVGKGVD